jgi:hypothetical protein
VTGVFSVVFIGHLRAALRWLKLLSDEATEHLQSSLTILLGKSFPEPIQSEPPTPNRSRRKKVPSVLRSMVPLLEGRCDHLDTNRRASKKQKPILPENPVRIDTGQLRESRVCSFCNRHKGPNIAGIDPISGEAVPLFNPRRDRWPDHFEWNGPVLLGKTSRGLATIQVLAINHEGTVNIRRELIALGACPRIRVRNPQVLAIKQLARFEPN